MLMSGLHSTFLSLFLKFLNPACPWYPKLTISLKRLLTIFNYSPTLSSANFLCHKHFPHNQVSDNNPFHGLKLWPASSSWDILCKNPWTNVNGYFIDYFLGTTAEGFVLSHASLKNNKHLNILSSQLNRREEEQVRITRANSIPGLCLRDKERGLGAVPPFCQ